MSAIRLNGRIVTDRVLFKTIFSCLFFFFPPSPTLLLIPSRNTSTRFMLRQLFTTCFQLYAVAWHPATPELWNTDGYLIRHTDLFPGVVTYSNPKTGTIAIDNRSSVNRSREYSSFSRSERDSFHFIGRVDIAVLSVGRWIHDEWLMQSFNNNKKKKKEVERIVYSLVPPMKIN